MKLLPLLLLPVLLSSCTLLQLPARIINSALGPLVEDGSQAAPSPSASIALRIDAPPTASAKRDR